MENPQNLENKSSDDVSILCDDCKELVGKKRYTPPHKNLKQTSFKEVKSQFGNVDEYSYSCNKCGKEWFFEGGKYGEGWM